jgi:hypothetical protein
MKFTSISRFSMLLAILLTAVSINCRAQNGQAWPPGVQDVVNLNNAHVSDPTIIAYIHNSGLSYNFNAGAIIMLHQQGLSDQVIGAMIQNQPQNQTAQVVQAPQVITQPVVVAAPVASSPIVSVSLGFGRYYGNAGWFWYGGGWHPSSGYHGGYHGSHR